MSTETPFARVVDQRIRNRLIEYLEFVSDSEYKPPQLGFDELLNQWEDWVSRPITENLFPAPVYTEDEVEMLRHVDLAWEAFCDATPRSIKDEAAAIRLHEWAVFVRVARQTLNTFSRR